MVSVDLKFKIKQLSVNDQASLFSILTGSARQSIMGNKRPKIADWILLITGSQILSWILMIILLWF